MPNVATKLLKNYDNILKHMLRGTELHISIHEKNNTTLGANIKKTITEFYKKLIQDKFVDFDRIFYKDQYSFILMTGVFALSGSVTNWIAVHMLFDKVPFLYGSGVILDRFEDIKLGLKNLILQELFSEDQIKKFLLENKNGVLSDYPRGALLRGGSTHWNAAPTNGPSPSFVNKSNIDDIGFFNTMLEEINLNNILDLNVCCQFYVLFSINCAFIS